MHVAPALGPFVYFPNSVHRGRGVDRSGDRNCALHRAARAPEGKPGGQGRPLVSSSEIKRLALKAPERDPAGIDEPTTVEVIDTDVFGTNQSCLAPEEVVHRFQADQNVMGGKVVMLTDGLQQSFSDAWRLKALVAPVKVSSIVAHLFEGPAEEWAADVIEFDANRCAMSRTLVPSGAWNELIKAALDARV